MNWRMKAYTQCMNDNEPTRCPDWDFTFEAESEAEAMEIAYEIHQSFDSHNNEGAKWVEGPFLDVENMTSEELAEIPLNEEAVEEIIRRFRSFYANQS